MQNNSYVNTQTVQFTLSSSSPQTISLHHNLNVLQLLNNVHEHALLLINEIARCRKFDIMDSMLHKLEKYADNLENIVQQRTAELIDEKQKTDMLLHRMLPT